jgi:acyl-CoA dehydrogenase
MPPHSTPFELTKEQREIQKLCVKFAAEEIRPRSFEIDENDGPLPWDIWNKASGLGLTSYHLPEKFGGGGFNDATTACVVNEALAYGCAGIGSLLTSNGFFADPVMILGTEAQQQRWVAPLCAVKPPVTALATTEPGSGSDAASIMTHAKRVDDGYLINGQKSWISNAPDAEYFVVFATVAPGTRSKGITAFVLERGDEGLTVGKPTKKMGQRAIPNAELFLKDVLVADDRRLGEEGQGFSGLMGTFDRSRVGLAASEVGIAQAALDYAVEYARQREQFGRKITEFQAVSFRLADMAVKIQASRLLAWNAARLIDSGKRATTEAAMAKLHASETAMYCTWAAMQTLGGWAYSRDYPVEKWLRDAKLEELWEGTSDIQRLIISRGIIG